MSIKHCPKFQAKSKFHEEQISSYNEYIKQCLANLQKSGTDKKKRVRFQSVSGNNSFRGAEKSLRYSASRLHQKGILLSIDGLPQPQFKNVQVRWNGFFWGGGKCKRSVSFLIKKGHPRPLFCLFSLFSTTILLKNYRLQRDSYSDGRIRRRVRWPLHQHHGPNFRFIVSIFALFDPTVFPTKDFLLHWVSNLTDWWR